MGDPNLRLKLESGASRVFNVMQITRGFEDKALVPQGPASELFFSARTMNGAVIIKEPNTVDPGRRTASGATLPVRTKLFLPYDAANPYEGGESVFMDEPGFEDALRHLIGDKGDDALERLARDMEKLRLLEQMPSLDPFLLKDKFSVAGVAVNESYFRIGDEEWRNIRAHIRDRFALMCRFAMDGKGEVNGTLVDRLVDRIWEARELEPLYPLLSAFGLPTDRAAEFFYSWKGVAYYDYEFTRNTDLFRAFSGWLQSSQPRGPVPREDRESIERDRAHIRNRLRESVGGTLKILKDFQDSFDLLFRKRETARGFADFMIKSRGHFWTLGNSLNSVYHAMAVWDQATRRIPERSLPPAQMVRLLRILREMA